MVNLKPELNSRYQPEWFAIWDIYKLTMKLTRKEILYFESDQIQKWNFLDLVRRSVVRFDPTGFPLTMLTDPLIYVILASDLSGYMYNKVIENHPSTIIFHNASRNSYPGYLYIPFRLEALTIYGDVSKYYWHRYVTLCLFVLSTQQFHEKLW